MAIIFSSDKKQMSLLLPHVNKTEVLLIFFQDALGTMTVDEYFAKNPQVKEKIDDEIRNQNWGY